MCENQKSDTYNRGKILENSMFEALNSNDCDNLSASINLEDIIHDYDEQSRRTTSISSFLNNQFSQSYYSVLGTKDEETTSFHTALQDGFSTSELELVKSLSETSREDNLWNEPKSNSRETISQKSHFQIVWDDLEYKIRPKMTLGILRDEFDARCRSILSTRKIFRRPNQDRSTNKDQNDSKFITILRKISGSFKSGELTAVMGPSGAGKTSLLNFLSRRREEGYSGRLMIEDPRRVKISTIPQNDQLPGYLSVRENLMFASRLNNPQPNHDHHRSILKVASLLGLNNCLDVRTKKISGGQHKRVAIAQELLSRPDILILDEPTSGLDSLTCHRTLSVLKDLIKLSQQRLIDPIAIVLTIHQPQHDIFDLFDKIYVLANGGIAVYNGPPGSCIDFIQKHSGITEPYWGYNPASFVIEIASGEFGDAPITALANQVRMEFESNRKKEQSDNYQATCSSSISREKPTAEERSKFSKDKSIIQTSFDDSNDARKLYIDEQIGRRSSSANGSLCSKIKILSKRHWLSSMRDPKQMFFRIIFHVIFPILLAVCIGPEPGRSNACPRYKAYYHLKDLVQDEKIVSRDVEEELLLSLENLSQLFILAYALYSANNAVTTLSFTLDMQVSLKEHFNGWYSMPAYLIARLFTDAPYSIFLPAICIWMVYPLTDQVSSFRVEDCARILISACSIVLATMIGQTIGMIVGALYIGHVSTALFVSQGVSLPLVFTSGFIVRTKNMSKFIYAISNLSLFRHTLDILVIAKYGFNVCDCDGKQITGKDTELLGLPDGLSSFTRNWIDTMSVPDEADSTKDSEDGDIYQMFARQISLYNTLGIDVKSCSQMVPFHMHDLSLEDSDLLPAMLSLITSLLSVIILLFIIVKIVVKFRTSL